jgi:sensor histidine kinase regulating citrate/malate metabolism
VHIYQIILNLVTNSIHACEENSTPDVTHKIDIHIKTDDSHMIIAVHDTGCGMSEECLHSINSRASVTSKTGSGIGLSHIHTVIHEILQGTLSFKPNKPTGTICTVTLPKQKKKD